MKHIHTFESFLAESLSEAIEIIAVSDYGVSNRNKKDYTKKHEEILSILSNPEEWTDDLAFQAKDGNVYHIDDLIDKEVKVGGKTLTVVEESLSEREFSAGKREELAKSGEALPDGSFPIVNVEDLKNAIKAYGRAKDQTAAAKHIAKRAKALGAEDLIPQSADFQGNLK